MQRCILAVDTHAGLDKLWNALQLADAQDEDVFTLAANEIERLRALNEDKHRHLEAYRKAASDDKAEIERLRHRAESLNTESHCIGVKTGATASD